MKFSSLLWSWIFFGIGLLLYAFVLVKVARGNNNNSSNTIEEIISNLGSDNLAVRQGASRELAKRMTFELYVKFRSFHHDDLEVCRRVELVAGSYKGKVAQKWVSVLRAKLPSRDLEYPWFTLSGTTWDFFSSYLKVARQMGSPSNDGPKYTDWRVATRLWAHDQIYKEVDDAVDKSKNEEELTCFVGDGWDWILERIYRMVALEDSTWGDKKKNPLRKVWGFD